MALWTAWGGGVEVGQNRAVGPVVAVAAFGQGAQGGNHALKFGDLALKHLNVI